MIREKLAVVLAVPSLEVDDRMRVEYRKLARERLTLAVQERGVRIFRPEDIAWSEGTDVGGPYITATYSPDPTTGCQLVGGPLDGALMSRERETWAPTRVVHLRQTTLLPNAPEWVGHRVVDVTTEQVHTYQLRGIDATRGQWVYGWVCTR